MRDNSAGAMERKRQIDREIRALESELLGHIDSELYCLNGLLRNAEQNWLSAGIKVTRDVIDAFAKRILDGVFMSRKVLDRDSAIEHIRKNFKDYHAMLKRNYQGADFDSILVQTVLNAECLSSKINFLNRLKKSGFLYLSDSVENLDNPRSDGMLERFKNACNGWLREWESLNGSQGQFDALNKKHARIMRFYLNMNAWIEPIAAITDAKLAEENLLSTYKTGMTCFEELREQLDSQS